ncbi:hypothetical protein BU17DRAFT_63889 [Hysterangium stoloniferum]|nr:hypothetical protein BU17DRAFT_63889 [Hysterangium stoloniferum]
MSDTQQKDEDMKLYSSQTQKKWSSSSNSDETCCSMFFASLFKTLESTIQDICRISDDQHPITFSQCIEAWQNTQHIINKWSFLVRSLRGCQEDCSVSSPAKDAGPSFSGKEVMIEAYKLLVHLMKRLLPKATLGGTDGDIKVLLGFDEAAMLGHEQGKKRDISLLT